ncbi:MAG: hypothetical protein ACREUU_16175, partial [Gammaproteobacteria bacterium]
MPTSGLLRYEYDANGNMVKKTDARGVIACLGTLSGTTCTADYDDLNRPKKKSYSDGTSAVTYCYDGKTGASCAGTSAAPSIGRLTWIGNDISSTSYQYDSLGRVVRSTQTTGTQPYSFGNATDPGYEYNRAGALTKIRLPSGRMISYGYDKANRIISATGTKAAVTTTYANQFQYTPHGAIEQMTLGNQLTETAQYNDRLQPTVIGGWRGGLLLGLFYDYGTTNNNGNVQSQGAVRAGKTWTQNYSYDPLNRLKTATESGAGAWNQTYVYDKYGNRALLAGGYIPAGSLTPQVAIDNPAQVEPLFPGNRHNAGVSYDLAGNIQGFSLNSHSYTFDAENRMKTATTPSGATQYFYDGEGRRVKKVAGATTTTYVYDAQGSLAAEYGTPNEGGAQYLTADHLGSTRLVTDAWGVPVRSYDYLPFGEDLPAGAFGRDGLFPT